jgi:hypothetical protein
VLRAPPAETDEDFEREFAQLMSGGEAQVRLPLSSGEWITALKQSPCPVLS